MIFATRRRSPLRVAPSDATEGAADASVRIWRAWPVLLLTACAVTIAVLAITVGAPEPPPTERTVERRLRDTSAAAGFPLHRARCARDGVLPRTFFCLIEGPFDMHLAWEVRWLPGGALDIRRPDGTRVQL